MFKEELILKTLALAGVEWELQEPGTKESKTNSAAPRDETAPMANQGFRVPNSVPAPISNNEILDLANRRAKQSDIAGAIKNFAEHPLYAGAKNTALPHIPANAKLLVITDIPSLTDDAAGEILTGPEGELFDKMMAAINLSRADIAITPLVFWRPAGGRTPTKDELSFCRPFINRIIADIGGVKILTLGALAAKEIIGATLPKDHGKEFDNKIPIYKPEYILQNPDSKKQVWAALQLLNIALA